MRSRSLAELDRLTLPQHNRVLTHQDVDRWFGVEHEYSVIGTDRSGQHQQVDFRRVISVLGLNHGRLDPGDPLAHFLSIGAVVTADGAGAEIATPPVRIGPSFSHQALGHTSQAYVELEHLVRSDWSLRGYSTHISIQVPDRRVVTVGQRFVNSVAPAMMLLLDHQDSPGLLVRPRRGRLELCGDYVSGDQLRAASVFGASAAIALQQSKAPKDLRLHGEIAPARERFGYYIDRCAFGPDLYELGRGTRLSGRQSRTAQQHMEQTWEWVRPTAQQIASAEEVQLVDDVVLGNSPIPLEARLESHTAASSAPESEAFGRALASRTLGQLSMCVTQMRWDCVIFEVSDHRVEESVFITVPGTRLEAFLNAADTGALDHVLNDIFPQRPSFPVLASVEQTSGIGAFARVGRGSDLVPGERNPMTGKIDGPNGPGSREHKEQSRSQEWPKPQFPKIHPGIIAALIVAVLFTGLIGALFLFGGDEQAADFDEGFNEDFDMAFDDPDMFEELERQSVPELDPNPTEALPQANSGGNAGLGGLCGPMTTSDADEFFASAFDVDVSPGTSWISSGGEFSGAETGLPGVVGFERCLVQNPSAPTGASGGGTMIFIDIYKVDPNAPNALNCESADLYTVSTFIIGCGDDRVISIVTNEYPQDADPTAIDDASLDLLHQFFEFYGAESFHHVVSRESQSGGTIEMPTVAVGES